MPTPSVKGITKKPNKVEKTPKSDTDGDNYYLFTVGTTWKEQTNLDIDGAYIHGYIKEAVSDASSKSPNLQGSGSTEYVITVEDCDCTKFSAKADVAIREFISFSVALSPGTYSKASGSPSTDALDVETSLKIDLAYADKEAGQSETTTKDGKKTVLDLKGEAKSNEIPGASVGAGGDLKIENEQSTQTKTTGTYSVGTGATLSNKILHIATKQLDLKCGDNKITANSNLNMTLTTSLQVDQTGKPINPEGFKESTFDVVIQNDVEVKSITGTDCDGNKMTLKVPQTTVVEPPKKESPGSSYFNLGWIFDWVLPLMAGAYIVNVPDELKAIAAPVKSEVAIPAEYRGLLVEISSSEPSVITPVRDVFSLDLEGIRWFPLLTPTRAGTSRITIRVPQLNFIYHKDVEVTDFKELGQIVTIQPESLEIPVDGIANLRIIRSVSYDLLHSLRLAVSAGNPGLVEAKEWVAFPPNQVCTPLTLIGRKRGTTQISVAVLDSHFKASVPVVVLPTSSVRVEAPDTLNMEVGEDTDLVFSISYPFCRPVEVAVSSNPKNMLSIEPSTVRLAPTMRNASVKISALRPGKGTVRLLTDFGVSHNVEVHVAGATPKPLRSKSRRKS